MKRSYRAPSGFVKRSYLVAVPLLALLVLLALPPAALGQGLPSYRPINPVAASRSGLSFEPYRDSHPGRWIAALAFDYASTIESNVIPGAAFVLDTELLRLRVALTRDLGPRTFVLGEAELLGAYGGVLDGFLEWYHDLLHVPIPERERRPKNEFLYLVDVPGLGGVERKPGTLFLGDARLGLGVRVSPLLQSVVTVTLPSATGPAGYGRGTISANLHNTVRIPVTRRLAFEAGLGAGYTPASGSLARWQRELAVAGSSGLRWRFWGRQSLYGNLFLQSPHYHDTTLPSLDRRELSFDFGWILAGTRGRELRVGMTEDLEPSGPAVDLVFRIGSVF